MGASVQPPANRTPSRRAWRFSSEARELGTNRPLPVQISYYLKATPKKVAAYEAAKLASDFDPQNRDENTDYYVGKLDELVKKFGGVTAEAKAPKQESLAL